MRYFAVCLTRCAVIAGFAIVADPASSLAQHAAGPVIAVPHVAAPIAPHVAVPIAPHAAVPIAPRVPAPQVPVPRAPGVFVAPGQAVPRPIVAPPPMNGVSPGTQIRRYYGVRPFYPGNPGYTVSPGYSVIPPYTVPPYTYAGFYGPIVANPYHWGWWGWNHGAAWYPAAAYWGGGFFGPFTPGVSTMGPYGGIVDYTSQSVYPSYEIDSQSAGSTLLQNYGLQQTPCGPPHLVVIWGPGTSVICTHPNRLVGPGTYRVDLTTLSLISR